MPIVNKLWRFIALAGLLVLAVAWSLAFWHIRDVEQKAFADTSRRMQTTAEAHASYAALSLAIADESLQRLQEVLKHDGAAGFGRVARIMSREDTGGGAITRAVLVGADGRTTGEGYVKGKQVESVDVSEREYFKAFRDDPTDRIFVTEPIIGKTSGKPIILFVRPVLKDGRFAGVIFVGLEAAQWTRLVKISDEEGLLITLLSPGNRTIARSIDPARVMGEEMPLPVQTTIGDDAFDLTSPIDGITRRTAVRSVPGWGMRIVAGLDHRVLRAEIAEHTRIALLPALLLSLILLPAIFVSRYALLRLQATERKRNEEAARSQTVLSSMSEGVLLVDATGVVTFANDTATRWLSDPRGTTFAKTLENSGLSLVTEDGNPHASADPLTSVCLQSGLALDDAWLIEVRREKQKQWLSMCAHPLFTDEGKIDGAVVTLDDRTDEHERIADAEMARTILDRMTDAVMITDDRASILMINAAYLRLSGFSQQELLGSTPKTGCSDRHDDAFWAAMWQALTQQKKWSGKVWNRRKDGSEYCVWHTITAVLDLRGRIARYVAVSRDITEQQVQEADLWQRANFDPLTGLANRTRFEDRLAQIFSHVARHEHAFAVCYLDLDRFKPINDTLGHAAGDAVLRQVAQRMRAVVRKDDLLARIGGDEFALLIPRLKTVEGTIRVAEKIISALNLPFVVDEGTAKIGVSIGIALYPEHGANAIALTANADRALYRAKAEGRNVWRLADADNA